MFEILRSPTAQEIILATQSIPVGDRKISNIFG